MDFLPTASLLTPTATRNAFFRCQLARQFVRVAAGLDCRLGHGLRLGPTKQSFHPVTESGSGSRVSEFNGIRQRLDLDNPNTADKCHSRQDA
jgi:hypothetical protein